MRTQFVSRNNYRCTADTKCAPYRLILVTKRRRVDRSNGRCITAIFKKPFITYVTCACIAPPAVRPVAAIH
eukprot:1265376-Pleurochrysis_carterae.AAC.4